MEIHYLLLFRLHPRFLLILLLLLLVNCSDIYEPLAVKEQVINAAAAACMILRIDDVIAASKPKTPAADAGAGAGGMGSPYGGD